MKPWFALVKALVNVNLGISALRARLRNRERIWEIAAAGAGILVGAVAVVAFIVQVADMMVQAGLAFGQPELVLTLAHSAAAVLVFVFGLAFVMGAFYFADDAEMLLAWPLRPRQILAAKFTSVLISEYLTTAVVLIPVYVVYALNVEVGALFTPAALVVFLATPLIPLGLASLLVVVLMRVVSVSRKRDFFTVVGGLFIVAASLALQYFLHTQGTNIDSEAELTDLIFGQAHSLSRLVAVGYPPSYWSMLALAGAGALNGLGALAGFVAAGAAVLAALLLAGERAFLRAAQSVRESASGRRRGPLKWEVSTPVESVARAERKVFMRTPVYVLNGFASFVLFPAIALLPQFTNSDAIDNVITAGLNNPLVGIVVIWAWLAAAAGLSLIPSTAVSREGGKLWVLKSLPISGREYFLGKLRGAVTMILLGALPGALVLAYVMRLQVGAALLGLVLGAFTSVFFATVCLTIDAARPWLTWTDPTRAIKSNVNGFFGMIATAALIGVPAWAGVKLAAGGADPEWVLAGAALLYVLAFLGLWLWLSPRLDELFQRAGD